MRILSIKVLAFILFLVGFISNIQIVQADSFLSTSSSVISTTYYDDMGTLKSLIARKPILTMEVGDTVPLSIIAKTSNGEFDITPMVFIHPENPTLVNVANTQAISASVTALKEGKTTIYAEYNGVTTQIPVTVVSKGTLNSNDVSRGLDVVTLSNQRSQIIDFLNKVRTSVGVSPLQMNNKLNQAAQAHSNYLAWNFYSIGIGHSELQTDHGFTGVEPRDRTQAAGYPDTALVGEVVSIGSSNSLKGVRELIDAPLHRVNLLLPNFRELGVGINGYKEVINLGESTGRILDADKNKLVYYPYDGQRDVPPSWFNAELPNPLGPFGVTGGTTIGYPITVESSSVPGSNMKLRYRSGSIIDQNGNEIDFYILDNTVSGMVSNAIVLLPKKSLLDSTTYTVNIVYDSTELETGLTKEFSKEWSFTTVETISKKQQTPQLGSNNHSNYPLKTDEYTTGEIPDNYGDLQMWDYVLNTPTEISAFDTSNPFSDVKGHWAEETIEWARQNKLAQGYANNSFSPNSTITEAEFVALLFRFYGWDQDPSLRDEVYQKHVLNKKIDHIPLFKSDWSMRYYLYAWGLNLDFLQGSQNQSSRSKPISRYMVAQIVAGVDGENLDAKESVQYLLKKSYSQGKSNPTVDGYQGDENLTRAEAIQFIRNLKEHGLDKLKERPS